MKNLLITSLMITTSSLALAYEGSIEAGKAKSMTCVACHGPAGVSVNPMYPVLAGQDAKVLFTKISGYRAGTIKTPNAGIMKPMVEKLTDEDLKDLAAYFSSVKSDAGGKRKKKKE